MGWTKKKNEIGITQLTQHPPDEYGGDQMRATACIVACAPPTACFFFQGGNYSKLSVFYALSRVLQAAESNRIGLPLLKIQLRPFGERYLFVIVDSFFFSPLAFFDLFTVL